MVPGLIWHLAMTLVRMLPSGNGALLLQAIMTGCCIRRTKEMQDDQGNRLVPLPPVNFYSIKVDLHAEDRNAYDLAMAASKRKFEEFLANERTGNVRNKYWQNRTIVSNFWLILHRSRSYHRMCSSCSLDCDR